MSQNYTPTEWIDNRTVGTASVMNNMEKGIEDAHDRIDEVDSQMEQNAEKISVLNNELSSQNLDLDALDNLKEIRLTRGVYELKETLIIPSGCKLILSNGAVLKVLGNFDGVILEYGASISGGVIKTDVDNYSKTLLKIVPKINGVQNVNIDYRTRVENINLIGNSSSGDNSVGLQLDDSNGKGLCFINANNLLIRGFHTGILLNGDNAYTWINGNSFSNIDMFGVRKGIVMDCGFESSGNKFNNIQIQTPSNFICSLHLVKNSCYNTFSLYTWDDTTENDTIIFGEKCAGNTVYDNSRAKVNDCGWDNEVIVSFKRYIPEDLFHKEIDLTHLSKDYVYPVLFRGIVDINLFRAGSPSLQLSLKASACGWDFLVANYQCVVASHTGNNLLKKIYMKYESSYIAIYLRGGYKYKLYDSLFGKNTELNRLYLPNPIIVEETFEEETTGFSVEKELADSQIKNGMYIGFSSTTIDVNTEPNIK